MFQVRMSRPPPLAPIIKKNPPAKIASDDDDIEEVPIVKKVVEEVQIEDDDDAPPNYETMDERQLEELGMQISVLRTEGEDVEDFRKRIIEMIDLYQRE